MRNFFLIKHHPWGLTGAYQENSRRTRAPRHTHNQRSQGAMTTQPLYPSPDRQPTPLLVFFYRFTKDANVGPAEVSQNGEILLANSKSLSFSTLIFGKAQERPD